MGWFENLLAKRRPDVKKAKETFRYIQGYRPAFQDWSGAVYESELIRSALDAHARHASKLKPEVLEGNANKTLRNRLAIQPNPWQTWPKFLYMADSLLYARNNLFLGPVLDSYGEDLGVQIIVPERWELVNAESKLWIRFFLKDNKRAAFELEQIGIMTRFQIINQLFGESNNAMKDILDLIQIQRQGIKEAVRNGASFRFMAIADNWSTDEDLANERKRFRQNNFRSDDGGGGLLLFPNTYKEVKQIEAKAFSVDADQDKLIRDNVYGYFGVNEDILQNKAYGDAWAAFYEGATEWFGLNLGETITRMKFTERERVLGNQIMFSSNRLQYMSTKDKLEFVNSLGDRGMITRNEAREIFNLPPLPEPYGSQVMARGEYYNINEPKEPEGQEGGENAD